MQSILYSVVSVGMVMPVLLGVMVGLKDTPASEGVARGPGAALSTHFVSRSQTRFRDGVAERE